MNEDLEDDDLEPDDFILEMLTGTHEKLYDALADLPYMPYGLDADDEWV